MPRPCHNCGRRVELQDYEVEPLRIEAASLLSSWDEACGYAEQRTGCQICGVYLRHGDPIIGGPSHADCFLIRHNSPIRVRWTPENEMSGPAPPTPPTPPPQRNWVLELFGPDLRPKPVILHVEQRNPHTFVVENHRHSFETEQDAYDFVTHHYIGNAGTVGTLFQARIVTHNHTTFRLEEAEHE